MTAAEVYTRNLLSKGHGFPLWIPEPIEGSRVPLEYTSRGPEIGDVGAITSDGGFDFFFNVCASANHPINSGGVPPGFVPLPFDVDSRSWNNIHRSGAHISSASVKAHFLSTGAGLSDNPLLPIGAGASVGFSWNDSQGAILFLPEGASRVNAANLTLFQDYAVRHAESWYSYVNGTLGRRLSNDAILLVTGTDKSASWGVASWANSSHSGEIGLNFNVALLAEGSISSQNSWQTLSPVDVRSGPVDQEPSRRNQCVFIRGFKVSVRNRALSFLKSAAKVESMPPPHGSTKSPYKGRSSTATSQIRSTPFSASEELYHPSTHINKYLLKNGDQTVNVAVTHDEAWMHLVDQTHSLLDDISEDDVLFPEVVVGHFGKFSPGKQNVEFVVEPTPGTRALTTPLIATSSTKSTRSFT